MLYVVKMKMLSTNSVNGKLTRSDFDDSKKDKKPKPKDGLKVRTVTVIVSYHLYVISTGKKI